MGKVIEEVKKYSETVNDEEIHSKLIHHLFTICEMSIEDISKCYNGCTAEMIVKHIFEVYNIALKKCSQKDCLIFGKYPPIDNFYKDWRGILGVASKGITDYTIDQLINNLAKKELNK